MPRLALDARPHGELDEAGAQINDVLDTLGNLVQSRTPEASLDRDRLELIGASLSRDDTTLGAHLANRLYRRRRELQLIVAEHSWWFHTLLEDIGQRPDPASRVIPGWGLSGPTDPDLPHTLARYAKANNYAGAGALRSLHRLHLRPDDLWPADLGGKSTTTADEPDTSETPPGDDIRAQTWTEVLNKNVCRDAATDYLLQDADSSDSTALAALENLLEQVLQNADLNDESRTLLEGVRQALAGKPDPLADLLRYKGDDNAQWRLVERNLDKVSPELINELAALTINRRTKFSAIRAGLANLSIDDQAISDCTEATVSVTDRTTGRHERRSCGGLDGGQGQFLITGRRSACRTPGGPPRLVLRPMGLTGADRRRPESHLTFPCSG